MQSRHGRGRCFKPRQELHAPGLQRRHLVLDGGAGNARLDGFDQPADLTFGLLQITRGVVAAPVLEGSGRTLGEDLGFAVNPEFLREGSALADFDMPPKTVIGESDPESGAAVASLYDGIEAPLFLARTRRTFDQWQIIILVDESGSMIGSVIHAAVTAACLWGLPSTKTHLCIFDTEVVDLTPKVTDPVEVLMKVQLGGGTDIGQALEYASQLVENPRRTIVVLITDFYEGAPINRLYAAAKKLVESGVTALGLAALDERADPTYDHEVAARLVQMGWHVAAMTPGELASWVAEKVRK